MTRVPRDDKIGESGGLGWGWWRPIAGESGELTLRCPSGHHGILGEGHSVAADGTVTPSCVCSARVPCGFHEYVALDGWTAADAEERGK